MSESQPVRWTASRPAAGRQPRRALNGAWSLADVVLASRRLSSLFIVTASLGAAAVCVRAGGVVRLVESFPALAMIWGAAAGLVRLGRERRGRKPLPLARPVVRWRSAAAEGR